MCSLWELNFLRAGGEPGPPARWRGFGRCGFHRYRGLQSSSLGPFRSLPPSPLPHSEFTSLSQHYTFSSPSPQPTQSPLPGFKVVRIHRSPPPHAPSPVPWALGKDSRISSLLASAQHDLGDKVDNGRSRLVGVKLRKEVASVVRGAARLPGHEAEEPREGRERVPFIVRSPGSGGQPRQESMPQASLASPAPTPLQASRTGLALKAKSRGQCFALFQGR